MLILNKASPFFLFLYLSHIVEYVQYIETELEKKIPS